MFSWLNKAKKTSLDADSQAQLLKSEGDACLSRNELQQAVTHYREALRIKPDFVEVHVNLGNALREQGELDTAESALRKALQIRSGFIPALFNLATLLSSQNRLEESIGYFREIIRSDPELLPARIELCKLLFRCNRLDDAYTEAQEGELHFPASPEFRLLQGNIHYHQQRFQQAIICYRNALDLQPDMPDTLVNLAKALYDSGDLSQSLACYEQALVLQPDRREALIDKAVLLTSLGQANTALSIFEEILKSGSPDAVLLNNFANALFRANRIEAALEAYSKAIEFNPEWADAWTNRGIALASIRRFEEAIMHYDRAIQIQPSYADAHFNRSFILLMHGNFQKGWNDYEWRFDTLANRAWKKNLQQPRWDGNTDIRGKTLLVHAEQGLGDTLQFIRYLPALDKTGAKIFVQVQESLIALLQASFTRYQFVTDKQDIPNFDFHIPLLSLGKVLRLDFTLIPYSTNYIQLNHRYNINLSASPGNQNKPVVGIAWSGTDLGRGEWHRSIPLKLLLEYLPLAEINLVSLQKEIREQDNPVLAEHAEIQHFGNSLTDFVNTAAIIDNLDLVISIDTAVAHLAGAMNKPLWLLLPYNADWRWFLNRSDSPWYPSAQIFRQDAPGDWHTPLEQISRAIVQLEKNA